MLIKISRNPVFTKFCGLCRTLTICMKAVKKDVNTLEYVSQEKRYELFDNNTKMALIEKV